MDRKTVNQTKCVVVCFSLCKKIYLNMIILFLTPRRRSSPDILNPMLYIECLFSVCKESTYYSAKGLTSKNVVLIST